MTRLSETSILSNALSKSPKQRTIQLAGTKLNILEWGEQGKPGLLFVHGGAAHARWWNFITPYFLPNYHCIAIDLSGHGDSAWRSVYSADLWREEVLQLADSTSFFHSMPVIIGHSMGGLTGIRVAAMLGSDLPGLVVVDSAVRPANSAATRLNKHRNLLGKKRIYDSREQIMARFRLVPPQDCNNGKFLQYIAAESIMSAEGSGWTWKYDPQAFRDLRPSEIFSLLKTVSSPTLIIRGQNSRILDRETAAMMYMELANANNVVEIADASHHVLLDQPVMLIEEIKSALKQWNY